jgi:hypothetical protein
MNRLGRGLLVERRSAMLELREEPADDVQRNTTCLACRLGSP